MQMMFMWLERDEKEKETASKVSKVAATYLLPSSY